MKTSHLLYAALMGSALMLGGCHTSPTIDLNKTIGVGSGYDELKYGKSKQPTNFDNIIIAPDAVTVECLACFSYFLEYLDTFATHSVRIVVIRHVETIYLEREQPQNLHVFV